MPDSNDFLLWRYMPLVAFIRFLQTGALRLPKASHFDDLREGHHAMDHLLSEAGAHGTFSEIFSDAVDKLNNCHYVSCWHLSSSESLAMWKIYGGDSFSIAITAKVGRVMEVFHRFCKDESVEGMCGEVIYGSPINDDNKFRATTLGLPFGSQEGNLMRWRLRLRFFQKLNRLNMRWSGGQLSGQNVMRRPMQSLLLSGK